MDSARFENANKLWSDGRKEEATREFHAMAEEEADYPDGNAALRMNELNCYLQISELDKANEVMRQIRLAILCFTSRAFAQAKFQLETALQIPGQSVSTELRKQIYQQMSRVCHYLGETEEEQKYLKLMQSS